MVLNTVKHILQSKSLAAFSVLGSSPLWELHARTCRQPRGRALHLQSAGSTTPLPESSCSHPHPLAVLSCLRLPPSHTTGCDKAQFQTQNVFTERRSNWFRSQKRTNSVTQGRGGGLGPGWAPDQRQPLFATHRAGGQPQVKYRDPSAASKVGDLGEIFFLFPVWAFFFF